MNSKKRVLVTCGPIPARVDSVKYLTNMFKGGLAFKTAAWLSGNKDFEVSVLCWKYTKVPDNMPQEIRVDTVNDVFEYYDWITANAKNFDAFIMAAAVANLTPVHPYEGKFPSHNYKPGDEFDIRFMIAPRAIDAIKPLNPRCCLIGYKLFDEPDNEKLIDIARHTLADARANLIFANRPSEAKSRKIAVTADGSAFFCSFDEHMELIARAIRQTYFSTNVTPLSGDEESDPDIREAFATVSMYEHTFDKYGTVGVSVKNHPGMFATTSRGHRSGPVLVRQVDNTTGRIEASGKATLNAPALSQVLKDHGWDGIVIHRHFDDPLAEPVISTMRGVYGLHGYVTYRYTAEDYIFPGTAAEAEAAGEMTVDGQTRWTQPFHGYIIWKPIVPVDWNEYRELFPKRYFKMNPDMLDIVKRFRDKGQDVLEIGGNRQPIGNLSYDPYTRPDPGSARPVSHEELVSRTWPCVVCFNAVNYLTMEELREVIEHSDIFIANTFRKAPACKITEEEYAVLNKGLVRHGLRLPDDGLMRHTFYDRTADDFKCLGLACREYGKNSMLVCQHMPKTEE